MPAVPAIRPAVDVPAALDRLYRIRDYMGGGSLEVSTLESYRDDEIGFITRGLGQALESSWWGWRVILKAAYGRPLDPDELAFFRDVAQRDPPGRRVRELWLVVGRRGGKDSVASLIAVEEARFADCVALRPGERALIACLACDRDQAGIVFGYISGYFDTVPALRSWVRGSLPSSYRSGPIQLRNSVDIAVTTNNFRAPRGRAIPCAIFDEVAFWRSEDSATPDVETYRAVQPGMATMRNSMMVGISSPYRKSGLLYQKWRDHFGRDDPEVLVIQAETRKLNPVVDVIAPGLIDKALADDPEAARAEYLAQFREDLADFVPPEVVDAVVVPGRTMIEPQPGVEYFAFVDPSGGSRDSFTLAIAHAEPDGRGILDLLYERRAPFIPSDVVDDIAKLLPPYGLHRVKGDHYAGEWPVDAFDKVGIEYVHSEMTKSEIYRDSLPLLMSRQVEYLDNRRLVSQTTSLERRTVRGGRDSIDHPPNANDDVVNAALGALVHVTNKTSDLDQWRRLAAR